MKINGSSLFLMILTAILSAFAVTSEGGHFRNRQAVSECSECYVCSGPACNKGLAAAHGHHFGRNRSMPAPVYFANTYPEYINGSPNIYAGFDEYDQDVVSVNPVRGRVPFRYNYWNDQYENNPYYGKQWDKNWTITSNAASSAKTVKVESEVITTPENTTENAPAADQSAPQIKDTPKENADEVPAVSLDNEKDVFAYSPVEGSYQGHYIYNFESFCDDQDCCLLTPLVNAFHALVHCPCSGLGCHPSWNNPCADNCGLTSGCLDGGCLGGGCLAGGCLSGGCLDNCCLADGTTVEGDLCADIYVDPCCSVPPDITCPINAVPAPVNANNGNNVINTPVAPTVAVPQASANDQNTPAVPQSAARDTPKKNETAEQSVLPAKVDNPQADQSENEKTSSDEEDDISIPEMKSDESNEDGVFPAPSSKLNRSSKNSSVAIRQFSDEKNGYIQISVPEKAVVFINDYQTKMTGKNRIFVAKDLIPGEVYPFEIRVVLEQNGQFYAGVKETSLTAGNSASVAFRSQDFTAERRVASR